MPIDFQKTPSDQRVSVWIGPTSGATGITEIAAPEAGELNNTGGASMMLPAHQSISWNDFDFGTQASETNNEPSLADIANYEEFGASNFGGSMSFYYPAEYDDNSNMHSQIYDLTDQPGVLLDVAVRIDGDVQTSEPAEDGDFVSAYRVSGESETNPFTPGESKRRTVGFTKRGEFAPLTVVGDHEITILAPGSFGPSDKGRIRATQQGRDVTNRLTWTTTNGDVINVYPGGFFEVTGEGTATVTATDPGTGDSETAQVSVSAGGSDND